MDNKKRKIIQITNSNNNDNDNSEDEFVEISIKVKKRNIGQIQQYIYSLNNLDVYPVLFKNMYLFQAITKGFTAKDIYNLATITKKALEILSKHNNLWQRLIQYHFPYVHSSLFKANNKVAQRVYLRLSIGLEKSTNIKCLYLNYQGKMILTSYVKKGFTETKQMAQWPYSDCLTTSISYNCTIGGFRYSLKPHELINLFTKCKTTAFHSRFGRCAADLYIDREKYPKNSYYLLKKPNSEEFGVYNDVHELYTFDKNWVSEYKSHFSVDLELMRTYIITKNNVLILQWNEDASKIESYQKYKFEKKLTWNLSNGFFMNGPLIVMISKLRNVVITIDLRATDKEKKTIQVCETVYNECMYLFPGSLMLKNRSGKWFYPQFNAILRKRIEH